MADDPVIYLELVDGGSLTVGGECRMEFRTNDEKASVVMPIDTARRAAGVMFTVVASLSAADGKVEGLAVDSVRLLRSTSGGVLQFGIGRGMLPIHLDRAQLVEFQQDLERFLDPQG